MPSLSAEPWDILTSATYARHGRSSEHDLLPEREGRGKWRTRGDCRYCHRLVVEPPPVCISTPATKCTRWGSGARGRNQRAGAPSWSRQHLWCAGARASCRARGLVLPLRRVAISALGSIASNTWWPAVSISSSKSKFGSTSPPALISCFP
jgi:hypothetical protein